MTLSVLLFNLIIPFLNPVISYSTSHGCALNWYNIYFKSVKSIMQTLYGVFSCNFNPYIIHRMNKAILQPNKN